MGIQSFVACRLNSHQIHLCHDASIQHFETVMITVKAMDLTREFADGFDVLRERGHGQYDMELPVFDTPNFSFLTDPTLARWMRVLVHKILGQDALLIHKGMFLSLPGAEPQGYHHEGLHLMRQYQRPCHSINVFVPLVDLTIKNGPTEFWLGSHVL